MNDKLDPEIQNKIRKAIVIEAEKLLDVPYKYGSEVIDLSKIPEAVDCSELVEFVYHRVMLGLPDGSQNQFNATVATDKPKIGDLCFMGKGADITKVYHVGIVFSDKEIIEARAYDGRDWTGKVTLRDRKYWEEWHNFIGYRVHPKLI